MLLIIVSFEIESYAVEITLLYGVRKINKYSYSYSYSYIMNYSSRHCTLYAIGDLIIFLLHALVMTDVTLSTGAGTGKCGGQTCKDRGLIICPRRFLRRIHLNPVKSIPVDIRVYSGRYQCPNF